jgi:hypothetical protein
MQIIKLQKILLESLLRERAALFLTFVNKIILMKMNLINLVGIKLPFL